MKNLNRTRDRLKKSAVKHKLQHLMNSYKQYRNRANALNKKLKKQYFSDKINGNKGNMKDSWQTIYQLLNKRSQSTNIVSLKESNQTIFDKQRISNEMNEYFCSIGEKLAADIVHTSNPLLSKEICINGNGRIFDFREINEGDIHQAVSRIKVKKSFGNDNISGYFLKIVFPYISRILKLIFNTSIETSTFPVSWKIARVIQIYKGEKSEKLNYRPISVLPVLSRLFEKLIYDQLYQCLEWGGFLTSDQSGFRALHASATCLLKCTDDWY